MSEKEVLSRIVQRGSFTFTNTDLAVFAVVRELNTLVKQGQARYLNGGHDRRWRRVIRDEQIDVSDSL